MAILARIGIGMGIRIRGLGGLTALLRGRLAGRGRIVREVALCTWSVRPHGRAVVRPGCVLLGGVAPDELPALGLWVGHLHTPSCAGEDLALCQLTPM
jgi:hypothetical protein